MSVHFLKIKVTSLAAEIRLIRREEHRVKPSHAARKRQARYLALEDQRDALAKSLVSNELTSLQREAVNRRLAEAPLTPGQRLRAEKRLERSRQAGADVLIYKSRTSDVFWGLRGHRSELSVASREANLAYGFLRGRAYQTIERDSRSSPDWDKVYGNVVRFGVTPAEKDRVAFDAWVNAPAA